MAEMKALLRTAGQAEKWKRRSREMANIFGELFENRNCLCLIILLILLFSLCGNFFCN